jgi:outer membrane receptor protein involved in Fe transport
MLRNCLLITLLISSSLSFSQSRGVSISGEVKNTTKTEVLPFVNVTLSRAGDTLFVAGTVTNEEGRFTLTNVSPGSYTLRLSYAGYHERFLPVLAGRLNEFLDLSVIEMEADTQALQEVILNTSSQTVSEKLDKKTFSPGDNISQAGGSLLQSMKNLPGITVDENGKVMLRGSDKVTVLIDGKQTALTGFGNQAGLDNIPASAVDKIEIINNPSAKYDANGNAGIINIVYKKIKQPGFNGKIGITSGLGALRIKKENYPGIQPQYQYTPKINPSLSLNYRKTNINLFLQADYLYNKTLNRNEFAERIYSNGDTIYQQVKRNRITTLATIKSGFDWLINEKNTFTVFGLYSNEYVRDSGDIPYFKSKLSQRMRLWQFYEDEVNSAATVSAAFQHKFKQPGHVLNIGLNYTFHREDEKYFLWDTRSTYTGRDTFMLIADEHVTDLNIDYVRPLKHGRFETGTKFRRRNIPTDMRFFPGINSPLDVNAAGWAKYREIIPAVYGNYVYESYKFEVEAGLRVEYVDLDYTVNPNHNTYKTDGYSYFQPFPSVRVGFNASSKTKLSFFYNRRVDRPDEGDIRIFPKYDEPEILKVGNPGLRPQFTQTFELGNKSTFTKGYLYTAIYHRRTKNAITRIGTTVPGSSIIYSLFQNTDRAHITGIEMLYNHELSKRFSFNINLNGYYNTIAAFTVENKYPVPVVFSANTQTNYSGNLKMNGIFHLPANWDIQLTSIYLAPDIIPQGKIAERYSLDLGVKKLIQKGKGELYFNGSDLLGTLRVKKQITGSDFRYTSSDYYETQVVRLGYSYKF